MIQSQGKLETDVVDECAIPDYKGPAEFDTPECGNPQLEDIVKEFKFVFALPLAKPLMHITAFTHRVTQ